MEFNYKSKPDKNLRSNYYNKKGKNEMDFNSFPEFKKWYNEQEKKCCYCGVEEKVVQEIVMTGKLPSNRFPKNGIVSRGRARGIYLEVDRKNPKKNYSADNCELACYFCNNDKSDVFDESQYPKFFKNRATFLRGLLSLVLVLCSLFSIAQVPSNVPTNGLVSYWPFNGNANDESGNGNNLITNGAPSFTSSASSNTNSAALFPNGNDYYTTPTSSWSLINNFSNGTVSFWVNINSTYVSNHYFGIGNSFIVKQKHGCCADLFFGMLDGTTKLRFGVHNSFPNSTDLIGNTSLIPNNWYHVVGTWDGITVKLYVNGVVDNTLASSVGMSNMTNPDYFNIGSSGYGGNGSTNFPSGTYGALDDIGIWNRALTQQEITDLYNSCTPNTAIDVQTACDSYTWIDGNTYAVSNNIATDTLTNVAGCDSIVTLDLTITGGPTVTITQIGADLEATLGDVYLWSTTGITQVITPDTNGTYWCIVTGVNGCASDTAFFDVTYVGIDDVTSIHGLMIYPNPSGDIFNISFNSQDRQTVEIKVLNIIGKVIFTDYKTDFIGEYTHQFNLKNYSKGIYFLEIKTENGSINQKLMLQ